MGRDHSNIMQLSKHNLGGTISIPGITHTSEALANRHRFEQAKDDLERYCKVFNVDFDFLMTEMMERVTTLQFDWRNGMDWARRQVVLGNAKKLPPKKKEYAT